MWIKTMEKERSASRPRLAAAPTPKDTQTSSRTLERSDVLPAEDGSRSVREGSKKMLVLSEQEWQIKRREAETGSEVRAAQRQLAGGHHRKDGQGRVQHFGEQPVVSAVR